MRINKINKYVSTFETKKEKFIFYKNDLAAVIFKDKFKIYTTEEFYKRTTVKNQLENTKCKLIIIDDLSVIIWCKAAYNWFRSEENKAIRVTW